MPPTWLLFSISMGVSALSIATLFVTLRAQVPPLLRGLAYFAILYQLASVTLLLWSIEPGNELPTSIRAARGLIGLVAWVILGWTAVTAWRRRIA